VAAAVWAVVAWGVGNVVIASVPMNGLAIAFHRLWFGTVIYLVALYASGRRLRRATFRFGWAGGVAYGADIATFFLAVRLTSVATATTVSALQPLVLLGFAAAMFGERIRARHVVATVVSVGGVAMVAFGAPDVGGSTRLGDLFAVLALIAWAAYFVTSKRAREQLGTFEYMTVNQLVAFLVVAPFALAGGALGGADGTLDPSIALRILLIVLVPHLSKDQDIQMGPGDVIRVSTPGGGGYGDPAKRDPAKVERDVARGYYTREDAARLFPASNQRG